MTACTSAIKTAISIPDGDFERFDRWHRVVIAHGDVVWVDFGSPRGSEPAKRRPAVIMQEDWLEFLDPHPVRRVPGYTLTKIGNGIRLVMGI